MGKKRTREPGPYGHAGELLKKAIEKRGLSRKEFADELGVKGGERSITHWILGETWPREPEIRVRMRALLRDAAMDELESEWAKVLGKSWIPRSDSDRPQGVSAPGATTGSMKSTASKKDKHSVESSLMKWKLCRGGCGYTVLRRSGPLSWCWTCWWLRQTLLRERVRSVAALSRKLSA